MKTVVTSVSVRGGRIYGDNEAEAAFLYPA